MNLETFYLSLSVKNIRFSKIFYEKLGFTTIPNGGSLEKKWLIMTNGKIKIGLFQDMFPNNTLTFNPPDVRAIYRQLKAEGFEMVYESESLADAEGPCSFVIVDPDGNPILFDQH
ncbi:VOC family protein [Rapidithrix thailandica]|uniref:VOC family protein n=1 Tax=Rapidithrix thailandica TaxID=413964 RepID=A0AAW9S8J0_9BACT